MAHSRFPSVTARLLGVCIACGFLTGLAAAQESVAGKWAIEVDSPQGLTKALLTLTVDGETLKGTIGSDMGDSPFTGTVSGGTIKFSFDFAGPQGAMTIMTTGTVTGDDIKGEMDYGMGTAPFVGKRAEQ